MTLQLLAKASLNVAAIKENYNFLKPFKDSVGLIALVFTIWLSDVEFSWKKKKLTASLTSHKHKTCPSKHL